ncbi:hypothetical protein J53TS2_33610 [Paenibacillus sp. J53TS2]|nr:hypothetical protein J53TS2_33610 [Paenibacillus sp. J53TS2]
MTSGNARLNIAVFMITNTTAMESNAVINPSLIAEGGFAGVTGWMVSVEAVRMVLISPTLSLF